MTPGDERFAQSMADLSGRLRAYRDQHPPTDPITALKNRQAALKAYDQERRQKLWLIGGGVGCVFAAGALAWGIVMLAQPEQATAPVADRTAKAEHQPTAASLSAVTLAATAPRERASTATPPAPTPPDMAQAVTPADEPQPRPQPDIAAAPKAETPPQAEPSAVEVTTVPEPDPKPVKQADAKPATRTPADQAALPPSLSRNEVVEAQRLLSEFGFDPGPIDGSAGPLTREAVSRYQEKRGLTQTGALDGNLLQQLRQDPSPRTVMTAQRPPPPSTSTSPPPRQYAQTETRRTPAIFRPVEMAGQQITTWLNSVFR